MPRNNQQNRNFILGDISCYQCEGEDCESPKNLVRCDQGVYACQLFVKPMANGKKGMFRRMCSPKEAFTYTECLGIRNNSNFVDTFSSTKHSTVLVVDNLLRISFSFQNMVIYKRDTILRYLLSVGIR